MHQALLDAPDLDDGSSHEVLLALIAHLKASDYRFITPTPVTHERVVARPERQVGRDLADIFGWSLPFAPDRLPAPLLRDLDAAGLVEHLGARCKSRLRASSLDGDIYLHSAFPTDEKDAVFFGPDSYRFARLIRHELARCPRRDNARLVDIGTGAGVGAIVAGHLCPDLSLVMTDINPAALRLAHINAQAAGIEADYVLSGDLAAVEGDLDIVLANPPYIVDEDGRDYRDGGAMHGAGVALDMTGQALPRLAPGGRFILYTGSAIERGVDKLQQKLRELVAAHDCTLAYEEIDPDIFGEELDRPGYRQVDRIALVSAVIARTPPRA